MNMERRNYERNVLAQEPNIPRLEIKQADQKEIYNPSNPFYSEIKKFLEYKENLAKISWHKYLTKTNELDHHLPDLIFTKSKKKILLIKSSDKWQLPVLEDADLMEQIQDYKFYEVNEAIEITDIKDLQKQIDKEWANPELIVDLRIRSLLVSQKVKLYRNEQGSVSDILEGMEIQPYYVFRLPEILSVNFDYFFKNTRVALAIYGKKISPLYLNSDAFNHGIRDIVFYKVEDIIKYVQDLQDNLAKFGKKKIKKDKEIQSFREMTRIRQVFLDILKVAREFCEKEFNTNNKSR